MSDNNSSAPREYAQGGIVKEFSYLEGETIYNDGYAPKDDDLIIPWNGEFTCVNVVITLADQPGYTRTSNPDGSVTDVVGVEKAVADAIKRMFGDIQDGLA